jgi:2,4-dienoyl-CoA reductase-like NADH-dependent reductase (Old Yellow Enzyme family)
MIVRISCEDWVDGGWTIEESASFCCELKELGVDLVDCSSGGITPDAIKGPVAGKEQQPGYQVPLADRIRRESRLLTAAVGLISEPEHADNVIQEGQADIVLLGREILRTPHWPLRAAAILGIETDWPKQYRWAIPR